MDPPSYGRGPNGEVWRLEDNLQELLLKSRDVIQLKLCSKKRRRLAFFFFFADFF